MNDEKEMMPVADENIEAAQEETTGGRNRFKSWALWVSVAGAISVLFSAFGIFDMIGITSEKFDVLVGCIGTILSLFGIVNNPTAKDHF